MISFISSLEIVNVILPDLNIFLWIVGCVANVTTVNINGIKTLLANCLSTFLIKDKFLIMVLKVYLKNCTFLFNWSFDIFILVDELVAKVLQNIESYV